MTLPVYPWDLADSAAQTLKKEPVEEFLSPESTERWTENGANENGLHIIIINKWNGWIIINKNNVCYYGGAVTKSYAKGPPYNVKTVV